MPINTICDALADILLGSVDLGADLACFKVTHPPRLRGSAQNQQPIRQPTCVDTHTALP